jgi:CDP-diacylglycerol--glycerol-3-phosphate 3-phosphatidyltransferase
LADAGITANQVTGAAMVLSFAHGAWIWLSGASGWSLALLPLTLFIRMALNAIDGMLAREFDMKSRFGALFNELSDVLSDAALYLPFMLIIAPGLVAAVVVLAVVVEMAGAIAPMIDAERQYQGPFGKSDRAVFFGLGGFLLGVGVLPSAWFGWALWVALALSIWTGRNRVRGALAGGSGE